MITTVYDICRIDIYSVSCTMMDTCINSITRKGDVRSRCTQGVTGSSSHFPPPGIEIVHVLEMTDGV